MGEFNKAMVDFFWGKLQFSLASFQFLASEF